MFSRLFAAVAAVFFLGACSASLPKTDLLVDNVVVGALAALPDGGVVYGEQYTGVVKSVTPADPQTDAVEMAKSKVEDVTTVDVSKGGQRGLLGLLNDNGKLYAAWTDAATDALVVGEITKGSPTRLIWIGPKATNTNIGGRLAMSPLNRLAVSIGDLQEPDKINDPNALNGKIITLDPNLTADQRPNIVSRGWTNPRGLVYDRGGNLWVVDGDRLARAGEQGTQGDTTKLGTNVAASGLSFYADKELLVCQANNKRLERYLTVDGVRVVPGRTVAKNCAYDVVQQKNGTITYATDSTIRAAG